jgi:hypothetical protein
VEPGPDDDSGEDAFREFGPEHPEYGHCLMLSTPGGRLTKTRPRREATRVNAFDKVCAVFAFVLGCVLLGLGALGLFMGCKAYFTLPAILGGLPALVGWGIVRSVVVAWRHPPWQPPRRFDPDETSGRFPSTGPGQENGGGHLEPPLP